MKVKIVLIVFSALLCAGCAKWRIKRQMELLCKSEIRFPSGLEVVRNGRIQEHSSDRWPQQIKLVVYYAAERCSTCEINRMLVYQELFELGPENFTPVIIMGSNDMKYDQIVTNLRLQAYSFPVYIDKKDEFPALNPNIPREPRFHTFLLDKSDRVILIGDPLSSEPMRALFKSTLDNMLAHGGVYMPSDKD